MANPKGHLPGCMCKACRAGTLEAAAGFLSANGCGLPAPLASFLDAPSPPVPTKVVKNHLPGCICKDCRNRPDNVLEALGTATGAPCGPCGPANGAKLAAVASEWWGPGPWWEDWWDDGSWWSEASVPGAPGPTGGGWEESNWWNAGPMGGNGPQPTLQPVTLQPLAALPTNAPGGEAAAQSFVQPAAPVGDMKEEVQKFCEKFDLNEDNQKAVIASLEKCGQGWVHDLRDLDYALSKARNPATLLVARLREIQSLRGLKDKAKSGHLPGCMCPTCKELSFARAVGGAVSAGESAVSNEAKSLNAAALFAYQHEQEVMGGPSEEPESAFKERHVEPKKGKGKGKPLVLPTGDLLPEVKAFCARFGLVDRLQTKVMDTLRKRQDHEWRQDLAEMTRDLAKARNPSGLLVVKLGDIQKELNPNQLCFNYRAGTCTWGDKCRWSHDVAVGSERMKSSALLAAAAKGTIASLPVPPPEVNTAPLGFGEAPANASGAASGAGFGENSGASKVDKLLRRRRKDSSEPSPEADLKASRPRLRVSPAPEADFPAPRRFRDSPPPEVERRRRDSPANMEGDRRRRDSPIPNAEGDFRRRRDSPPKAEGDFRRRRDSPPNPEGDVRRRRDSPLPNAEGDFRRRRDSPPPNAEGDFRRRRRDSPPPNGEGDFRRRRSSPPPNGQGDFRRRRDSPLPNAEGDFRRRRDSPPEDDFRRRRPTVDSSPEGGVRRRRAMESPSRRPVLRSRSPPRASPRPRSLLNRAPLPRARRGDSRSRRA